MKAALGHDPCQGHHVGGRVGNEARAEDHDVPVRRALVELCGFDLDADRLACRQPADGDLRCLVVWKGPEQAAVLELVEPNGHFVLAPATDDTVLIARHGPGSCSDLLWQNHTQARGKVGRTHEILGPFVSGDWTHGHVCYQQGAAAIDDPTCFLLEFAGVHDQQVLGQAIAFELDADDQLAVGEQVVFHDGDYCLVVGDHSLGLHLSGQIPAVVQSVEYAVDATVEGGQKYVESSARLGHRLDPHEKLARLADRVLTARRPIAHRDEMFSHTPAR